jgi:hypothetical protein
MKVYIIKDEDVDRLLDNLDRDPKYGARGGSSQVISKEQQLMFEEVHRFYNFQIRRWLDEIRK